MMKKGFTLAEIMVVLVVIGVLTCILTPIVANSIPDKNVMKFKKADTTFKNVIHELVNSDKYYENGDLGVKKGGGEIDTKYLCQTMSDVLSTKQVNCSTTDNGTLHAHLWVRNGVDSTSQQKQYLDSWCKTYQSPEIETSDGIFFYQASPACHFGVYWNTGHRLFGYIGWESAKTTDESGNITLSEASDFDVIYKPLCIDIDGVPKNDTSNGKNCDDIKDICPFGYGVRADGKILPGERAEKWLAKDFQGKDPSEQE